MAAVPTWLLVTVPLVVLPVCALGALALVGSQVADAQRDGSRLVPPEVILARIQAARAAFRVMTPAQHLTAARTAMAAGYVPARGMGGDFTLALQHLAALPPEGPWAGEAHSLTLEIAARETRAIPLVASALASAVHGPHDHGATDCQRRDLACELSHVPLAGNFSAVGASAEVLRLTAPGCSQAMLDGIAPAPVRPALRTMGFQRIECEGPSGILGAGL